MSMSATADIRVHGGGFANYTLPSIFTLKRTLFIFLAPNAKIASYCLGKILLWGKTESHTPVEGIGRGNQRMWDLYQVSLK